jgi:hypothetical protein
MNTHRLISTLVRVNELVAGTDYTAWLTGRSVYDVALARDIDIRLTGLLDAITLAPLLESLASIQYVDAAWVSDLVTADATGHLDVHCVLWYPGHVPAGYNRLGQSLIQGNYLTLNLPLKSHQRRCLAQYNHFPCVGISEFLAINTL